MRSSVAVVLAAALALNSSDVRAGGFTMSTFGARRVGMQANMGNPDDLTALFHNPAALADQGGVQLYLYAAPAFLDTRFKLRALDPVRFPEINPAGCGEPGNDPCPWSIDSQGYYADEIRSERSFGLLPYVGAATDLGFISPKLRKVVASIAVTAPNFYGAFLPENAPTAYHVIGGMFLVLATTAGVGWRINKYIAVGANVSYNYMYLTMKQKLSVINALTPPGEDPDNLTIVAQDWLGDIKMKFSGTDHGAGWAASVLITPIKWMSIGLAYQGATPAKFHGPVSFRGLSEEAQRDPEMLSQLLRGAGYKLPNRLTVQMPIPPALLTGVMFRISWYLEVGADARFWFYQIYNRQKINPHYDPAEPGEEPMTEENLSREKHYHLSFQVAVGALFRPISSYRKLEFMTGLGYDHSPIPDRTFTLDNPSLSNVKFTWGVRWRIDRHWRLGMTYLFNIFLERDVRTSETDPPTNGRGHGYSHTPSFEMTYRF